MNSPATREPAPAQPDPAAAQGFDRLAGLSDAARRLLQETTTALRQRDQAATARQLAALQALAPSHPEVLRLRAAHARLQGRLDEAITLLQAAVAARPADALAQNNLAHALSDRGDFAGATQGLRRCAGLEPERAQPLLALARLLERHGDIEAAHEALRDALQREPDNQSARLALARVLQFIGRIDAAASEYRAVLAAAPDAAMAWYGLSTVRSARFDSADLARIERVHARTDLRDDARAATGFALAKALEDNDREADAFAALVAANALWRRHLRWDAGAFSKHTQAIEAAFAQPPAVDASTRRGEGIVFIFGMPRSGSSLTEQILAAHPQFASGGELEYANDLIRAESQRRGADFPAWVGAASTADWTRLGEEYLGRVAARRGAHARITDKSLMNWRYVGALRAMLPGARFVNCHRDALETCLACFRQMFAQGLGFSYDLAELAAFRHDYERAMRRWHALHAKSILDIEHEALLADPEAVIRRLLAFCDVAFDPACLRFHEVERSVATASAAQVREPLRTDTARAARYGDCLDALRYLLSADPS